MTQNHPTTSANPTSDKVIEDLITIGRTWAECGLTIGRLAVIQSARTLERSAQVLDGTAELLSELSGGFRVETTDDSAQR